MRRNRLVAAALAATTALTTLAAPAAQAAPTASQLASLVKLANGNIATANCDVLRVTLRGAGLAGANTTRGQLVGTLNGVIGQDAALRLVTASTVGALGDRAVACGIVKPDPVTPMDQAIKLSSQLSSQAGLPQLRDVLPAVR